MDEIDLSGTPDDTLEDMARLWQCGAQQWAAEPDHYLAKKYTQWAKAASDELKRRRSLNDG